MNEPQEPRSLREVLDDLKCTLAELERTLNSLDVSISSMGSLSWKFKLLLYLSVVGSIVLVSVVLGQR